MHRDINKKRKARRLDEAQPLKSKSSSSNLKAQKKSIPKNLGPFQLKRSMDRLTEKNTAKWIDGWMDGWMDGWIYR